MISGCWLTGCIHAAARLGLASRINGAPRPVAELAGEAGADEDALYRLLRALASVGIFAERGDRSFSHTPLSEALRPGVPGSLHGVAVMTGLLHLRAWPEIVHSVRTGGTAFEKVFGMGIFEHLADDVEAAEAFDEAMAGFTAVTAAAVVKAYDFAPYATIVDVGGGNGTLLAAILHAHPELRGTNFDLPSVLERARTSLAAAGLGDRAEAVAGDFFTAVPAGGDVYTLKTIVHDWDDERAIAILKNVRRAMQPGGRVLVIESVIDPSGGTGAPGKLLDINMLVMTGGRERTPAEFAGLLAAAGLSLGRMVAATPTVHVIEGLPA
jgi:SAM-dependent methyltransferase